MLSKLPQNVEPPTVNLNLRLLVLTTRSTTSQGLHGSGFPKSKS